MHPDNRNVLANRIRDTRIAAQDALDAGKTIVGLESLISVYAVMENMARRLAELESRVASETKKT